MIIARVEYILIEIPYFDLAPDIIQERGDLNYGGRVFVNFDDDGCLCCYNFQNSINQVLRFSHTYTVYGKDIQSRALNSLNRPIVILIYQFFHPET